MNLNKKIFFLLCSVLFSYNSSTSHPFYVSICQVDFNETNNSLEISLKIFTDDLILGLENTGASKLFLGEKKENPKTDVFISNYLQNNLKFVVNKKIKSFSFIGKEFEDDVTWIYIEITDVQTLKKIEVECKLLTEVLETQSNIIHINNGAGIKSILLNKRKQSGIITF